MASDAAKGTQATLPDPDAGRLSQSCFELMLIELVPMAQRLTEQLYERELAATGGRSRRHPQNPDATSNVQDGEKDPTQPQTHKLDDDELREATFYRLEGLGYRVGQGVVEALTANTPLLSTQPTPTTNPPSTTPQPPPLDTIKFLCKDLWTAVFRKQIDNLKTNHRGVFVLTDARFEPLRRASIPKSGGGDEEARARAAPFLFFPAGVVRGALAGLGIDAVVQAEVAGQGLPGAIFQIRTAGAGGR